MRYQYVLNTNTKRLHLMVDGMTNEQCNVDQLKHKLVSALPPKDGNYWRCSRCMVNAPIGPVA